MSPRNRKRDSVINVGLTPAQAECVLNALHPMSVTNAVAGLAFENVRRSIEDASFKAEFNGSHYEVKG